MSIATAKKEITMMESLGQQGRLPGDLPGFEPGDEIAL